ncbi:MAG: DUF5624 domain-containing protein, partial [Candidatus Competibacteraceae bacterium]|nr:DUF5624 domain-containing protein [Candidatus Competibacteraceae bacterium]
TRPARHHFMRSPHTQSLMPVLSLLWLLVAPAMAHSADSYTTPKAFMDLFFDFTGSNELDYPAGQPTLGQMLTQAEIAKEAALGPAGPLVLVFGSTIDIYDATSGARQGHEQFRADRSSGFYELTAISHIGPALAYLAEIRANGDTRWKTRLASLQTHVGQVRALNRQTADHWLDQLDPPAWRAHKAEIRNMIDYACAQTLDYISRQDDGNGFTTDSVNDDFFNGVTDRFPIPFRNVMIATFMLEALRGASEVQATLSQLAINWSRAMVLVSSRAGTNVSSGLTEGTNWLVLFLKAASGFTLPDERIKIVPYAEVRASLGQERLTSADLDYYVQRVWGPLFYRRVVSDQVFSRIPTLYLPGRPSLPGDYGVTDAGAIDQFMIRLKHSLRDSREMLSNTVAFWMVQELANKNWDPATIAIPGLTTGFPQGVSGYPEADPQ